MTPDIPWPHIVDHDAKTVSVYIAGGYPTTMGVPFIVGRAYPDYDIKLLREAPGK